MYLCSSSSACGIVNSCTDSKTSELNIWGLLSAKATMHAQESFCISSLLPSSSIITGCAICGEHKLGGRAGRMVLESC